MSIICNYAVLRFQPYPETGEFANLGIVMLCSDGQFLFRIETKARKRITDFFKPLKPEVFIRARKALIEELKRVATLANQHRGDAAFQRRLFRHLIAPSETIFRFAPPGTITSERPAEALNELFLNYVQHKFRKAENVEEGMTKCLSQWLNVLDGRSYSEQVLGNDMHHVKFPLVWQAGNLIRQAIKPLNFDLSDASEILEKGDKWEARMRRLRDNHLAPADTVLVTRAPAKESSLIARRAYEEVCKELEGRHLARIVPSCSGQKEVIQAIAAAPAIH